MRYTKKGLRRRGENWEATFAYVDSVTGKKRRISRTIRGAKNEKAARTKMDQLLVELNSGEEVYCQRIVADIVNEYVDGLESGGSVEGSTIQSYRADAKLITTYLGTVQASELSPRDVNSWMGTLIEKGYAPTTVRRAYNRLKAALHYAQGTGEVLRNVCDYVKPPKMTRRADTTLSDSERERMLGLLLASMPAPLPIAIFLCLTLGVRREEVCGFKFSDFDESRSTLCVRRAIGLKAGGAYVKEPKTQNSRRIIPLPACVAEVLTGLKCRASEVLALRGEHGDPYIAGTWCRASKPYHPTSLSKDFAIFRDAHNFPRGLRLHDLRHGWATMALTGGVNVASAASMLGQDPATTLRVYLDRQVAANQESADMINGILVG